MVVVDDVKLDGDQQQTNPPLISFSFPEMKDVKDIVVLALEQASKQTITT